MDYKLLFLLPIVLLFSAAKQNQTPKVPLVKWSDVLSEVNAEPNDVYIINFWATWCRPCIEELPDFVAVHEAFKDKGVKVLLLSMDAKADLDTKVIPFLERKGFTADFRLLDETDYNSFIPQIDENWAGAIPATLVLHPAKNQRIFHAGKMNQEELTNIINRLKP